MIALSSFVCPISLRSYVPNDLVPRMPCAQGSLLLKCEKAKPAADVQVHCSSSMLKKSDRAVLKDMRHSTNYPKQS